MPYSKTKDWIFYEDGAVEPVRKGQSIYMKQRGAGIPDWYVDRKPSSWDPSDEGFSFTENHPSTEGIHLEHDRGINGRTLITGRIPKNGPMKSFSSENSRDTKSASQSTTRNASRAAQNSSSTIYSKVRDKDFEQFLYSGHERVGKALSKISNKAPEAIGEAFKRTYTELANNEELHDGLKFGIGTAWDVTQEVGKEVGSKAVGAISEAFALNHLSRFKHGKKVKQILSKPSVQSSRAAYDLGRQVAEGLSEYEEMAQRISKKAAKRRKQIYDE
jgi:hypothetical protein